MPSFFFLTETVFYTKTKFIPVLRKQTSLTPHAKLTLPLSYFIFISVQYFGWIKQCQTTKWQELSLIKLLILCWCIKVGLAVVYQGWSDSLCPEHTASLLSALSQMPLCNPSECHPLFLSPFYFLFWDRPFPYLPPHHLHRLRSTKLLHSHSRKHWGSEIPANVLLLLEQTVMEIGRSLNLKRTIAHCDPFSGSVLWHCIEV